MEGWSVGLEKKVYLRNVGRNCLKYHKKRWNRKEGRGNKDFKRGGKLGQGLGAFKKVGLEPHYELCWYELCWSEFIVLKCYFKFTYTFLVLFFCTFFLFFIKKKKCFYHLHSFFRWSIKFRNRALTSQKWNWWLEIVSGTLCCWFYMSESACDVSKIFFLFIQRETLKSELRHWYRCIYILQKSKNAEFFLRMFVFISLWDSLLGSRFWIDFLISSTLVSLN